MEREVRINGRRLSFFDSGEVSEASPVVLLIHGFPFDHRMWRAQCEMLPTYGVRVIAPDLPGFGKSEPMANRTIPTMFAGIGVSAGVLAVRLTTGLGGAIGGAIGGGLGAAAGLFVGDLLARRRHAGTARMRDYAMTLLDLLRKLGIQHSVHVAGLSMGGYVALEMAAMLPKRIIAGLILCDTRSTADSPEVVKKRRATATQILEDDSAEFLADGMIPKLLSESSRQNQPELEGRVRTMIGDASAVGAAAAARGMAVRPDRTKTLAKIRVPVTFVVGEEDSLSPPDVMEEMQRLLPAMTTSRLIRVPGAAHLAPMEVPECFPADFTRKP